MVVSVLARHGRRLLCDHALREGRLQPRVVLQEALAGQDQKVIAELRILEIDLEQLFVGDGQGVAVLEAFDGRRPPVFGRQETELAHEAAGRKFDADLDDPEFAGHGQEHFVGQIALLEQNVAASIFPLAHEKA